MVLPQWNANANAVLYVTDGEAQIQVVNDNGDRVFDGQVSQGQLLSIPQGFSVVKRATSDQFRWIEFKTNANAQINTLAGRTSVMRGLPLEVIANGYQISLEEARRVKFNTIETTLTHSSGPASYGRPRKADAWVLKWLRLTVSLYCKRKLHRSNDNNSNVRKCDWFCWGLPVKCDPFSE